MKRETKCLKCGKPIEMSKVEEFRDPKCGHCNLQHTLDKKSKRRIMIISGIVLVVIIFGSSIIMTMFNLSFWFMMIPALIAGFVVDYVATYLAAMMNMTSYEQVEKVKPETKVKPKKKKK